MSKLFLIFLNFALLNTAYAKDQSNWKIAKEKNGIIVYTRNIAGSSYKEFKGEVNIKASLTQLLNFIKKPEHCPDWQYKCIYKLRLNDSYIYKLSNLPWPLNDRYTVMQSHETFDKQNNTHTLWLKNIQRDLLPKLVQKQLPNASNTVQMRTSDGYWKFDLSTAPIIHITHQMHGDPAGIIPANLANLGVINAAYVTLDNLKTHFLNLSKTH